MRTAEDFRKAQQGHRLEQFLDEAFKYAMAHPSRESYTKYIYDVDNYLDDECFEQLEELGYRVYHEEYDEEGDRVEHQYIRISWVQF